ncbi:MAG: patatin-like phospholipase family protein [Gemmobacter sp.]
MDRPRIGLALGAGGARGWCHIGVIRGLGRLGIVPDVIAGTSMGALVGAAAAGGALDALEDWARAQTRARYLRLVDVRLTGGGLVGGVEIGAVVGGLPMPQAVEALPVPFAAVACDIATGEEVWLRDGPVADAVRASVAMPGVIAAHQRGGRWLIDGGVVNPIPVVVARALGAQVVIAVNPNLRPAGQFWRPPPATGAFADFLPRLPDAIRGLLPGAARTVDPGPGYLDLVSSTIDILIDRNLRARLAGDAPDVMLGARLAHLSVFDFHCAAEAIAEGERMVSAQADWIAACAGL